MPALGSRIIGHWNSSLNAEGGRIENQRAAHGVLLLPQFAEQFGDCGRMRGIISQIVLIDFPRILFQVEKLNFPHLGIKDQFVFVGPHHTLETAVGGINGVKQLLPLAAQQRG